jgi:hypothetical protein
MHRLCEWAPPNAACSAGGAMPAGYNPYPTEKQRVDGPERFLAIALTPSRAALNVPAFPHIA